jgi:hypothetical protein
MGRAKCLYFYESQPVKMFARIPHLLTKSEPSILWVVLILTIEIILYNKHTVKQKV